MITNNLVKLRWVSLIPSHLTDAYLILCHKLHADMVITMLQVNMVASYTGYLGELENKCSLLLAWLQFAIDNYNCYSLLFSSEIKPVNPETHKAIIID